MRLEKQKEMGFMYRKWACTRDSGKQHDIYGKRERITLSERVGGGVGVEEYRKKDRN